MILVSLFRRMIIFEHWMHVKVYFALFLHLTEYYFWDQLAAHRQTHAVSRSEHDYAKDHIEIVQVTSVQA